MDKKKLKKVILLVLFILFLTVMIYEGIKIYRWFNENKKVENSLKKIERAVIIGGNNDDINDYRIDFEILKQQNSDTVGYLKVNGTDIQYPVVKTGNNDYYLTHNYDKSYSSAGWVFMDYRNKTDDSDKNIIIYGHNRRDKIMFGTLKNILTKEWLDNKKNHTILFVTENEKAEYQVFSAYQVKNEDYYLTTQFASDEEFINFINILQSRSIKKFDASVNANDKILTLSTCADNNKYRVVLHAKKILK